MTADAEAPTLTSWLLEQIAADEEVARDALTEPVYGVGHYGDTAAEEVIGMGYNEGCADVGMEHFQRWMPARVLAECAAKRKILEQADEADYDRGQLAQEHCVTRAEEDAFYAEAPGELIRRALASVYADRDGFREEWR